MLYWLYNRLALMLRTRIKSIAHYVPEQIVTNDYLTKYMDTSDEWIRERTGIEERRYVDNKMKNSDIGTIAAERAIKDSAIDPEKIDYIIVGHNFGDVRDGYTQCDLLPSIASRIKYNLKIKNPNCVAYDVIFGCPGWLQGVIQADMFIKAGEAKTCLVIGSETLSRVVDPYDRDSMIYSDGAGACILELADDNDRGILSHAAQSFTFEEAYHLYYGSSFNPAEDQGTNYIKMHGRK
ncbi:MAG TPA: 3-oxoacyl-ACP synthase, partial [Saprospirales bacterium]|nr:3-oxoacyl-ACP synthase [Saprospirales bacterium]